MSTLFKRERESLAHDRYNNEISIPHDFHYPGIGKQITQKIILNFYIYQFSTISKDKEEQVYILGKIFLERATNKL